MSQKKIIWVHGDNLSPHNPVLRANPETPAIFIWDDALLKDWRISLKRITFIYECLLELPVTIRRGDITKELINFAYEQSATEILTIRSVSRRFRHICDEIEQIAPNLTITIGEAKPFVEYDGYIDLKRFSRYWRTVKKHALK